MARLKEYPFDTHVRLSRPNEYFLERIVKQHKLDSKSDAIRVLLDNAEILYHVGWDLYSPGTIQHLKWVLYENV